MPSRKWMQFRLKSLLVMMALFPIALWFARGPIESLFYPEPDFFRLPKVRPEKVFDGLTSKRGAAKFSPDTIIQSERQWASVGKQLFRSDPIPQIDFNKHFAYVIFGEDDVNRIGAEFRRGRSGRLYVARFSTLASANRASSDVRFIVSVVSRKGVAVVETDPPTRISYFVW